MESNSAPSKASTSGNDDVEITESAKKEAAKMATAYEDRPTAVLPGSHNTVTGTAINDWLDDDGNPKYGKGETPESEKGGSPDTEKA
jgi:hypothetical protein